jgi:antitoxin HicB
MDEFVYPARFTHAPEGGWNIRFRDLPDAISQADEDEDAIDIAEGCLQATIEGRLLYGKEIPKPSEPRPGEVPVSLPIETATKAALLNAVAASGSSRVALAKALHMDEKEMRRMLDPRHSSKLPRIEQVLKALGKQLRISLVDIPKAPHAVGQSGKPEARQTRAAYGVKHSRGVAKVMKRRRLG